MLNAIQLLLGFFLIFGAVGSMDTEHISMTMGLFIVAISTFAALDALGRMEQKKG